MVFELWNYKNPKESFSIENFKIFLFQHGKNGEYSLMPSNAESFELEPFDSLKWLGMPMGETIQFVPSMLDAGYRVVAMSFKFSTHENLSADLLF